MSDSEFEIGERALHIVGMPGLDIDYCIITGKNDDGTYRIKYQVYGEGPWHDDTGTPNKRIIGGIFKATRQPSPLPPSE